MKRRILSVAAVVAAAIAVTIPSNPQGMRENRIGQFWGTFVHWADFGAGQKFTTFLTMNVDGTFRAGNVQGVWERTGPRTVMATGLLQTLDTAGNLVGLERHRCTLTSSNDFDSYQGKEFADTVACPTPLTCPNPLDPKTTWTFVPWAPNGFTALGARVELVAPPLK